MSDISTAESPSQTEPAGTDVSPTRWLRGPRRSIRSISTGLRSRKRSATLLLVIVLLGGGLRAQHAANPGLGRQSTDERAYAKLAIDLSENGNYGARYTKLHRPLHWPPGAPLFFALGHRLDPGPDLRGAYWLQALVGTLLIPVIFALGAMLAGPVAGLGAATVIALYPPLIRLSGELLGEALGAMLLCAATLCTVRACQRQRWWPLALAGGLWGLAILTRAEFVFVPVLIAALFLIVAAHRRDPRFAARGAVLVAVVALTLSPWIVYASHRAGHFVLVTDGDAPALFVGTYLPGHGTTYGMKRVLGDQVRARHPKLRHVANWGLEAKLALHLIAARHPDLSYDDAIQREAYANLRRYPVQQPLAFGAMMLDKVRRTWIVSSRVGSPGASRALLIAHAILVIVSFLLAVIALLRFRDLRIALLLAPVLYSASLHAVLVAKPRYNLPPLPLLVVAGCVGAVWLWRARHPEDRVVAKPSSGS